MSPVETSQAFPAQHLVPVLKSSSSSGDPAVTRTRVTDNLCLNPIRQKENSYLQVQRIRVNANESTLMNNLSTECQDIFITFHELSPHTHTHTQTNKQCLMKVWDGHLRSSVNNRYVQDHSFIFPAFLRLPLLRLKSTWTAVCESFYIITGY